jgi:Bacterial membrane protein YfhO
MASPANVMASRVLRIIFAFQRTDALSIFIVCLLPVLLNAMSLFEWRSTNPFYLLSGLRFEYQPPILQGYPWIDPSIGSYSQSLGHLSAEEWLHGHVPWWNHFTGVGMPLAGEMCSESFFLPFVLLYHFPNGWIVHEVVLEILAGLGAYACFRKLELDWFSSLVGAALFASCGVFAWHGNPVTGPVAFLPWLIFGIESARSSAMNKLRGGWVAIALSLAYSIYGGFPETAYISGLFAGVWSISRFFPGTAVFRFDFAKKLLTGVIVGVLLSMPILVPFLEFLKLSYVGGHTYDVGFGALPREAMSISLFPWLYGGIFAFHDLRGIVFLIWSNVGGYLSIVQVGMILLALFIGRRKGLYVLLTAWIVVCFARTFGLPIISPLVDAIPLIKLAAFYRYAPTSWEFCSAMICAFMLNEIQSDAFCAHRKVAIAITIGLVAAMGLYPATTLYKELVSKPLYKEFFWISIMWGFALILAIFVLVCCLDALPNSKHRVLISRAIGSLLIVDSIALFIVPSFSGVVVKNRSIGHQLDFLKGRLGLNRFYTFGPVAANYGAYFRLASINHNYIPVSQRWLRYVLNHLDPYANAISFVPNVPRQDPRAPSQVEVLRERFREYEEVGVRYLLASHGADLESLNTLDFVGDSTKAIVLNTGKYIEGELIDPRLSGIEIRSAFVTIGNYHGRSDGIFRIEITGQKGSATGVTELKNAADDMPLRLDLDRPVVSATGKIHYKLEHLEGSVPVVIWSATLKPGLTKGSSDAMPQGDVPYLTFSGSALQNDLSKVYESSAMDIYELHAPKPYFEVMNEEGRLVARNRFEAFLDSPVDSQLIRRELFYPGWNATIDGQEVPIECYRELFQTIKVPPGRHRLRFTYRPTYLNVMMTCLLVGLGWIAFSIGSRCLKPVRNDFLHD